MLDNNLDFISNSTGEVVIGETSFVSQVANNITNELLNGNSSTLSPIKIIVERVKNIIKNAIGIVKNKDKKGIIFACVLSIIWIVLYILDAVGVRNGIINFLKFITVSNSTIIGKIAYASVLGSIASGNGKNFFKEIKDGFISFENHFFSSKKQTIEKLSNKSNLGAFLIGLGVALFIYTILMGGNGLSTLLIGISSILLCIKSFANSNGFWKKIVDSVTATKIEKEKIINADKSSLMLLGVTLGFILVTFLSLFLWGIVSASIGLVVLIIGIVFWFQKGSFERKEKTEKKEEKDDEKTNN